MEYTYASLASIALVAWLDHLLKTGILRQPRFWLFMGIMVLFMTIVNGYLTWRPIVVYGEAFQIGLRLGTIPIEDYLFGFGLITASVVVWEWRKKA